MTNNAEREAFVREERYVVIKIKDMTEHQQRILGSFMSEMDIQTRECVVVESDWPEYEPVWEMIEARMTGQASAQASGVPDGINNRDNIVPGVMRCAKCKFVLNRVSLNVNQGTVTSGNNKTEPCPNGCGPLWPMTWKQRAEEAEAWGEQMFDDLQQARAEIAAASTPPKSASVPMERLEELASRWRNATSDVSFDHAAHLAELIAEYK